MPCLDISKSYISNHIAFPAFNVNLVLDYISRKDDPYSLEPTNMAGMFVIKFYNLDTSYSSAPSKGFEAWDEMVPVFKAAHDIFNVTVIPTNPHGSPQAPISVGSKSGLLYIHFYSAAKSTSKTSMSWLYGYKLQDGQCDAVKPAKVGIPIKDDNGVTFAEYLDDNLYILFDLPHGDDNVTELLTRIMSVYFTVKGKTLEEIKTFVDRIKSGMSFIAEPFMSSDSSSRAQFARECNKLYEKNLKSMENAVQSYNTVISESNRKLIETIRERDLLVTKLDPLKVSVDARKEWANKEYDMLCATPHVKHVAVVDKIISVYTDMITIQHGGKQYNIGEFKIDIYTDGSELGVKAYNLTNPKNECAHPHVKQKEGYCCLGNISNGISKLLGEYQYVIVAQIMITFISSYNEDNPYTKISAWG